MHEPILQLSRGPARRQRGFTLPDVLVGTLIALTTLAVVLSFNRVQLFALRNQIAQVDVQTVGRNLTDLFTREIRRAGTNPTCVLFEAITEARADRIRFQQDTNGNGVIDAAGGEDIAYLYAYADQVVERATAGVTEPLLDGVALAGSRFRYFDGAGTELIGAGTPPELTEAERVLIRRVRIEVVLSSSGADPLSLAPLTARFSSDVSIRNRFFQRSVTCD